MELSQTIQARRAYRHLKPVEINRELVEDLARHAQLAASCFNKQPWNYVFVYEPEQLASLQTALSAGNVWPQKASMLIAVFSKSDLDCTVAGREYYLFDTGMATAQLILRAVDLGWVAHPIAGYDEQKAKKILGLPDDVQLITLLVVGKQSTDYAGLDQEKIASEQNRPPRKGFASFVHIDRYHG